MSLDTTITQEWFKQKYNDIMDDDAILRIPYSILHRKAQMLESPLTADRNEYSNMSIPQKRAFILGIKNNGLKPQLIVQEDDDESDDEDDEEEDDDEPEEVTLASALNFMLAAQEDGQEMTRFLQILSKEYKDDDFDLVRRMCTMLSKKTSTLKGDQKLGKLHQIGLSQFNMWRSNQTTSKMVVGALQLWNILERTGHGAVSKPSSVPGKEYLIYERPRGKIQQYDRFMVHSNYASNCEADDDEVNVFLDGLRMQHQTIEYRRISINAYRVAMAFLSTFQITVNKGKPASCRLIDDKKEKLKLPSHDQSTTQALELIIKAFSKKKVRGDSFIEVFENIARYADKHDDIRDAAADELDLIDQDIDNTVRSYISTFNNLAKQNGAVKGKALQKLLTITGNAADAVTNLANYRKIRNASAANTYVNHGVGSVRGYNLPEWYDTYHKGRNMVEWATDNGPEITAETTFSIYGVAYGHMTPLFTALRHKDASPKLMQFYDKSKARNSSETFIIADVFDHTRSGSWIFDDTDSHHLPKSHSGDESKFSGDHLKVSLFMETKSPVIVSKIDMSNCRTQDHVQAWNTLAVKHGYTIQIVKFGRLHNSECFLCAVPGDPVKYDSIRGDIWGIALCMDASNRIINLWQSTGMRAALREPADENGGEARASLGYLWRSLVVALPVNWPWYVQVPESHEFKTCAAIQEEQDINSYILPDSSGYEVEWSQEAPVHVVTEPRLLKPKHPDISYYQDFEFDCEPGVSLGYGADDDLQDLIDKGEVSRVLWDDAFNIWKAIPKKGKPKNKTKILKYDDVDIEAPPIRVKQDAARNSKIRSKEKDKKSVKAPQKKKEVSSVKKE